MVRRQHKFTTILCWIGAAIIALPPSVTQAVDAWEAFCGRYAMEATAQVARAKNMGCDVSGPRWDPDLKAHLNWCIQQNGAYAEPAKEGSWRVRALEECEAGANRCGPDRYGTPGCAYPEIGCKPGEKPFNFGVHGGRLIKGCFATSCDVIQLCGGQGGRDYYACCMRAKSAPPGTVERKLKDPSAVTAGCGKGMSKGKDGKCYPKLN